MCLELWLGEFWNQVNCQKEDLDDDKPNAKSIPEWWELVICDVSEAVGECQNHYADEN